MVLDHLTRMAHAVEDGWAAAWASLGAVPATPPALVDDTAACLRVCTPGMPEMLLNIVMRYAAAGPAPVSAADVERVIAPYRQHRLPFQWWLTLGAEPAGLRERLRALGLRSWGGATSMTLALDGWRPRYPSPAAGAQLCLAATERDGEDGVSVICDVFFLPREATTRWTTANPAFRTYLARLNGRPVAAMNTMWHDGAVLLFNVATLPAARRRGIAGNLAILALAEARDAGCALATLTATPEARRLYEELGFRACATMEQWVPGHDLMTDLVRGRRAPGLDGAS